jgi:hypothetical protein
MGNSPISRKVIFFFRTIERRILSWRDAGTGNTVVYSFPDLLRSLNPSWFFGVLHLSTLKTTSSIPAGGGTSAVAIVILGGQLRPYCLSSILFLALLKKPYHADFLGQMKLSLKPTRLRGAGEETIDS